MHCTRCGEEAHDYGSDGLAYCGSCLFYGMNKPCWSCRMYLPASELQTYKGQLTCPNCIMNLRDADTRVNSSDTEKEKRYASSVRLPEQCERCSRDLSTVYFYNGKHLCSTCVEQEKKAWDTVHGEGPPMAMYRIKTEKMKKASLIVALNKKINEFFGSIVRQVLQQEKNERDANLRKPLVDEKLLAKKDSLVKYKLDTLERSPEEKKPKKGRQK